jgi:hypothetical protein
MMEPEASVWAMNDPEPRASDWRALHDDQVHHRYTGTSYTSRWSTLRLPGDTREMQVLTSPGVTRRLAEAPFSYVQVVVW